MFEAVKSFATPETWSSIGFRVLEIGLLGEILTLLLPERRRVLDKVLSALFTAVIIAGVAIEHEADSVIAAKNAGRQLTTKQQEAIGSKCRSLGLSGHLVFVTSYSGDTEALRLGRRIKIALELGGLTVSDELGGTNGTLGGTALDIDVDGPDVNLVNGITKALISEGGLKATSHVIEPKTSVGPQRAVNGIMIGAYIPR